jgi:hypothetical protein
VPVEEPKMKTTPSLALRRSREFASLLRSLLWLTLAFFALAASAPAWADPPARVGRIADTEGTVWLYDDDQGEWIEARRNRPVTDGDRLSAERGARATVQIGAATLRLDGGTDLEFAQLDDQRVRVQLHGGSVALRVRGGRDGDRAREFSVATREGSYTPLRPGSYRVDTRNEGSYGAALAGTLQFEARDSMLDINAGQRAEFWVEGGGATHYAWSQLPSDRFGEWVASEDRRDDREFERNRYYVSPEMTGADDLERYGRWDRHPEYGTIWYPSTVAVGWAPYRHGHWAYVSPWATPGSTTRRGAGSAARMSAWASASADLPWAGCRWRRATSTGRTTASPTCTSPTSTGLTSAGSRRTTSAACPPGRSCTPTRVWPAASPSCRRA